MNATLLELPVETPESLICRVNCPAIERLERALEQLRPDFSLGITEFLAVQVGGEDSGSGKDREKQCLLHTASP